MDKKVEDNNFNSTNELLKLCSFLASTLYISLSEYLPTTQAFLSLLWDSQSVANLKDNQGFESSLSIATSDEKNEKAYNPFEHRELQHPNSTIGSMLHLLKACLGSGILAMPAAFKNSGIVAGSIGTLLAGYVCTHTISVLVKISQEVCVDAKKPSMSFSETCAAAFEYGPKKLRPWSNFFKVLVDFSLLLTYISVLCVYVVFIGSSIKEVTDVLVPESQLSIQTYCVLTLVPLVLLCQIRNLKYLVPVSGLANALIVIVFGITMYYIFSDLPPVSEREMVAKVSQWPLFVSTVIFAMEGIGVVMPVENEMKKPQQFLGCPGVLNISMVIVIVLYALFGFFGYVQYGEVVKGSITLNLPENDKLAQATKLLMAIVIYFSFPLQLYVSMEIITRMTKNRLPSKFENVFQITARTLVVTLTVGIAAAFPNLELVISFVGAVFLSTLGLLFPAIIEIVYRWDRDTGRFNYIIYKDIIIAIVSIIALVSGAYVSVVGLIEEFIIGQDPKVHNDTLT